MEPSKLDSLKQTARGYLFYYSKRYNGFTPENKDSLPTYSGFCDWAEKHLESKELSPFEKKLLNRFLIWLEIQNTQPATRRFSIDEGDITEFLNEASLEGLLL